MISIKLPYQSNIEMFQELNYLQKTQTNIIHIAFNRFQDDMKNLEITQHIKSLNNFKIGSWFIRSGIEEAKATHQKFKDKKIIFGGKYNLVRYLKRQITKEQYKENKLNPLISIGEVQYYGNRHFKLNIINNQIIFKPSRYNHYILQLPKLRKNIAKKLEQLELQTNEKKQPFTVKLTKDYIAIIFEEQKQEIKTVKDRVLGIDLNPNRIGYSICDYKDNNQIIIDTKIIEYQELNNKLGVSSDNKFQINQNNKRTFEQYQIVKYIIQQVIHYQCEKIIIEDLTMGNKDMKKGNNFNRLVNNCWNRTKLVESLNRYCNIYGIKLIKVNSAYSSIIGNTIYKNYPDPISASLEINRRGQFKYQKDKFYPKIPSKDYLNELWKQTLDRNFESWKELSDWLKKSKVKYRFSIDDFKNYLLFSSLKSFKSMVLLYQLNKR